MKRLLKIYLARPELAGLICLVLLVALFEVRSNGVFLNGANLQGLFGLFPETGLVALGVTLLMICGEFDLSVGSVFALMPMTVAITMTHGLPFGVALFLGLAVSAVVGLINGFITLRFSIPSFITTLGMYFMARSITVVISGGFPPPLDPSIPTWLFTTFIGSYHIIRASFIWFVGIAIVLSIVLSLTNVGNWIKATGGQLEAASAMGIPVNIVKLGCFVLSSMLAGFAGLIQVLRLGSPLPSVGEGMELVAVAAAVIGGTALTGGVGTMAGAVVGAALLRVIENGLVVGRVDANWFKFAVGALLVFAVVANSWLRRTARRIRAEV